MNILIDCPAIPGLAIRLLGKRYPRLFIDESDRLGLLGDDRAAFGQAFRKCLVSGEGLRPLKGRAVRWDFDLKCVVTVGPEDPLGYPYAPTDNLHRPLDWPPVPATR